MTPDAYPLAWPDGWPRTEPHRRKASVYKVSRGGARDHLFEELRKAGARNVVISSNLPLRGDGRPSADAREPADPGVAAYWDSKKGEPMSIACDTWATVRENLRALGLAIESLRQLERCGATSILDRAYSGFARLPAAADPWQVLGVPMGAPRDAVTARYRELAREHHPDKGGSSETMAQINRAYSEALNSAH